MTTEQYTVDFRFRPRQHVYVMAADTRYRGRIQTCIADQGELRYDVSYVNDTGEFKRSEFFEDELASREPKP